MAFPDEVVLEGAHKEGASALEAGGALAIETDCRW